MKQGRNNGHEPADVPAELGNGLDEAIEAASEVLEADEIIEGGNAYKPVLKQKKQLTDMEKKRVALGMRLMSMTYQQIADRLGYKDRSHARQLVQRAMRDYNEDTVTELRQVHHARLEHIIMLHWQGVLQRDERATAIVMSAMDRLARMHGLEDSERWAEQVEEAGGVLQIGGNKDDYIRTLRQARGSKQAPTGT